MIVHSFYYNDLAYYNEEKKFKSKSTISDNLAMSIFERSTTLKPAPSSFITLKEVFLVKHLKFVIGITACLMIASHSSAQNYANLKDRIEADAEARAPLVAHVTVVLCTNREKDTDICNENRAKTNLYWGAQFGVKTYFDRQESWQRIRVLNPSDKRIIDRVVFKRTIMINERDATVFLVADVWKGGDVKEAVDNFFTMTAGESSEKIKVGDKTIYAGGDAHIMAYIGHNRLARHTLDLELPKTTMPNSAIVLGRDTASTFTQPLLKVGSYPLLTTNGRMTPDAHTLEAAIITWFSSISPTETHTAAAQAYKKLRGGSISGRKKLFIPGIAR